MPSPVWSLHPQLEKDTSPVCDLTLCRVLAINDAVYPWLVLVPRRLEHDPEKWKPVFGKDHAQSNYIVEIADLAATDATCLTDEIVQVSHVLKEVTRCDKLNVGAIGNVVPQLHVHIVARWTTDPLWPRPVWGHATPSPGSTEKFERFVHDIRSRLGPPPMR